MRSFTLSVGVFERPLAKGMTSSESLLGYYSEWSLVFQNFLWGSQESETSVECQLYVPKPVLEALALLPYLIFMTV